jgi:hypothetical protein
MFDLFKQKKEERPTDVKGIRDALLLFIKEQLQKAEGGEGGMIRGMQLYLFPTGEEKHLYEAAVYVEEEGRFREEVQKIGDDYAIDLPEGWNLEVEFTETPPPDAVKAKDIEAGLFFSTRKQPTLKALTTAYVRVLNGSIHHHVYEWENMHWPRAKGTGSRWFLPHQQYCFSSRNPRRQQIHQPPACPYRVER